MKDDLESKILDALYQNFQDYPGSPEMMFNELYEAINVSPQDKKRIAEVQFQIYSLKKEGWVESQSLKDGQGGTAIITPTGFQVAEDRKKNTASTPEPEHHESQPNYNDENKKPSSSPIPASMEELLQKEPDCACLIHRDELLQKIIRCFRQDNHHFIVLYGQPMVGKTRMLSRLSDEWDKQYVPMMVTGQGLSLNDALDKFDKFVFDLADQLTIKFRKWARCHKLPELQYPSDAEFEGSGVKGFYKHWNRLMEIAGQTRPLVIFDELERLLDFPEGLDQRILTFIEDFVCNPDNGYFIIAGSERIRYSENKQFHDLIAKGHQHIRVGHHKEETVRTIFCNMQKFIEYEENVLQHFIALGDGHPRVLRVILEVTLSSEGFPRGIKKLQIGDVERIFATVMDRMSDVLWALYKRLSQEEVTLICLICKKMSDPTDISEYSLNELVGLAEQCSDSDINYTDLLEKGIARLEDREWVEWKDWNEKLFRFKLGIFPLWIQRRRVISFEEAFTELIKNIESPMQIKNKMETENINYLDSKILKVLYSYFQQHPGTPKMSHNRLLKISDAGNTDVIECLYNLQKKKWVDFDLTDRAEVGLVWLAPDGIQIAKDII